MAGQDDTTTQLDPELVQAIKARVAAMPPLTPEQLDALADTLAMIRLERL